MRYININGVQIDLTKMTVREASIKSGVNVETIKRMIKSKTQNDKLANAERETAIMSAGWNPSAGPKKGLRN